MIPGVEFQNLVTTGSLLIVAIGGLTTITVLLYGARWKSAWKVASTQANELRSALEDERSRADRAEGRERVATEKLEDALRLLAERDTVIERLQSLPNLERVIKLMSDTAERSESRFQMRIAEHERHATERHTEIVAALREVANVLRNGEPT